jgi:hypothetical protein
MAWLSFLMVTILWGLVGIGAPMMVPSSPQKVKLSYYRIFSWF